jgi:hypothetical protein
MELLPWRAFDVFLSAAVGLVAGAWLVVDAINLARARKAGASDPVTRDRRFGYLMGVIIAAVGVVGVVKHYL